MLLLDKFRKKQPSPSTVNQPNAGQRPLKAAEQRLNTAGEDRTEQLQQWIVVPPQPSVRLHNASGRMNRLKSSSLANLFDGNASGKLPEVGAYQQDLKNFARQSPQNSDSSAILYDLIATKFNSIVTQIDGENFSGDERELVIYPPSSPETWQQQHHYHLGNTNQDMVVARPRGILNEGGPPTLTSTNYFAKVNLYANSRLSQNLPPLKLYITTFPLLCLAAQYSERVYRTPSKDEREAHIEGDWRIGTKTMVIKSLPMDDMNTIVFAVRGSQTFMDWAVNLNSAPVSPHGFLDDPGNLCHAGFLHVAKKMIKVVAARLRNLLQEDPSRANSSLLITGHSAGGAVAALLYSHMLSTSRVAESELNILTGCFKRIHCVTFGAPPVSLLPLSKPSNPALRKSLFMAFINEGDPVTRAEKAYVRSLLELYAASPPAQLSHLKPPKQKPFISAFGGQSSSSLAINKIRPSPMKSHSYPPLTPAPTWRIPEATLCNAGRLVLLRGVDRGQNGGSPRKGSLDRMNEGVIAQIVTDDILRGVIWGDPVCHMMKLYSRRIEILATNAVVARGH